MADTFIVIGTGPAVNVVLGGAGASAYQIWLDAGNAGTEQDFLDSLEGPQGPAGATGATGATGPQGPPGDDAPVQTLSIDGNDLTLSDGGGTVTLPGGEISWPLLAPDGSAAAPSYSFSNSAETGIFYNNALLVASAPQGAVNARNIEIKSGSGTSGNGGAVLINAGNSSGRGGGQVSVTAGNSSGRNGGQINFRAGDTDTQTGGAVTLQSGNGATGGNYNMIAGSGTSGNGGTFYFIGGNSASALGGNIEFVAGNGVDQSKNGDIIFAGNQAVFPLLTISQRDNISVKKIGGTIFCTDETATDGSTGVQQVWNGSTWKNAW